MHGERGANRQWRGLLPVLEFVLLLFGPDLIAVIVVMRVRISAPQRSTFVFVVLLLANLTGAVAVACSADRKRRYRMKADGDPLQTEITLELSQEPDTATPLVTRAMELLRVAIVSIDLEHGVVLGKQRVTIRSWGEMLHVTVEPTCTGSRLTCSSWPSWEWTAMDWGAGKKLLNDFADELVHPTPSHDPEDDYPAFEVGPPF